MAERDEAPVDPAKTDQAVGADEVGVGRGGRPRDAVRRSPHPGRRFTELVGRVEGADRDVATGAAGDEEALQDVPRRERAGVMTAGSRSRVQVRPSGERRMATDPSP